MGKLTVRFKCHHCGHCCSEVVCLPTPWDVVRLVKETGKDPNEFLEFITPDDISHVRKSDPTWLKCGKQHYIMALRRDENGCYFRDPKTKFCWAYESRPLLCRLYPFRVHETRDDEYKAFSLHKDVGCPKYRDNVYETGPLYAMYMEDRQHQDDYFDLVDYFNDDDSPDKKPEEFIKLFIVHEGKTPK